MATKPRQIILADWEAAALAAGTTTALLRPIKPQPVRVPVRGRRKFCWAGAMPDGSRHDVEGDALGTFAATCPFGSQGTVLYGRETWTVNLSGDRHHGGSGTVPIYRAEHPNAVSPNQWRSPALMPKWASRIHRIVERVTVIDMETITPYEIVATGAVHNAAQVPPERWQWLIWLKAVEGSAP